MTAPDPRLGEIEAKLRRTESYSYPSFVIATADVAYLLAELRKAQDALGRVEGLAAMWTSRGEHDMAYSKTIPDEDIAIAILTDGATKVENARHIRAAVADATGGDDAND